MRALNPLDVGRIPLGHEPPGGDFARYVEQLSATPGRMRGELVAESIARTTPASSTSPAAMARAVTARALAASTTARPATLAARAINPQTRPAAATTAARSTTPTAGATSAIRNLGRLLMGLGIALLVGAFFFSGFGLTAFGFVLLFIGNAVFNGAKKMA